MAQDVLRKYLREPMSITEISPEQLKTRLDRGDEVVVVDLRQVWEYHAGHIPGALSLFIEEIPMRLSELPTDVDIVLQCWHGHSSLDVAAYMIQQGWLASRVASLSGGIARWVQTHGMTALEPA
jgi:adenylyltransferase/sulfurtransferase